ncbi:MAG TPA: hypothetical protein DCL42_10345 [Deltaproteobacteria bacterium]|nr:hypothetical protein [Deltaproteobacteria bacterium]
MLVPKLDLEALKNSDTLTEDQSATIALEVLQEEEAAKGEPSDEEQKETEEGAQEKVEEESGDKPKEGEEEAGEKKPEDENKDESDEAKKEEAEEGSKAEEEAEAKKKADEKEVEDYAKEHSVSIEEAREDFGHIAKIQEKYKNDPKHLAQANLHIQRLYTKTQEELKGLKAAPPIPPPPVADVLLKAIEDGKLTIDGKAISREDAIDTYRKENPKLESVEDEVVLDFIVKDLQKDIQVRAKEDAIKVSSDARDKREKLLSSLPDADKRFSAEIKPILNNIPDIGVVKEDFDLTPYILYAKGKVYDKEVKEAEEKGYKRGKEESKIIAKRPDGGVAAGAGGKKEKTASGLTDAQKEEALEHFANFPDSTVEQKYSWYKEILDDENNRKSNKGE